MDSGRKKFEHILSQNLLPRDGLAYVAKSFFPGSDADRILGQLIGLTPWRQDPIKIFGRTVLQPRFTAWMGDAGVTYRYSGLTLEPISWSQPVREVKDRIEAEYGYKFNSALLNYYRDGQDSMGWHRDNEPELGEEPAIASLSLGESRVFKMRHYFNKSLNIDLNLEHGDLLIMAGPMQAYWEHSLPKTARPKGPRVNITFRSRLSTKFLLDVRG